MKLLFMVYRFLSSLKWGLILLGLFLGAMVVGTFFPPLKAHKYIYKAWWLQVVLLALALNILLCGWRRRPCQWSQVFLFIVHVSLLFLIGGALWDRWAGRQWFVKLSSASPAPKQLAGLPFYLSLDKVLVERAPWQIKKKLQIYKQNTIQNNHQNNYIKEFDFKKPGAFHLPGHTVPLQILAFAPDFSRRTLTNQSSVPKYRNPAVLLQIGRQKKWLLANYPHQARYRAWPHYTFRFRCEVKGGDVRQVTSHLRLYLKNAANTADLHQAQIGTVAVNAPFIWQGYRIYQYDYDRARAQWSVLLIKRTPGRPLIIIGLVFLVSALLGHYTVRFLGKK